MKGRMVGGVGQRDEENNSVQRDKGKACNHPNAAFVSLFRPMTVVLECYFCIQKH